MASWPNITRLLDGTGAFPSRAGKRSTKKATVEEGLRILIRLREQQELLAPAGVVRWEGNLDERLEGRNIT